MSRRRIKVLFIAGNGRSGSTILDVILGQLPGFFAGGELRRIWERGVIANRPCGCGVPFRECPTWTSIFQSAFGGMDVVDPARILHLRELLTQTKHLAQMIVDGDRKVPMSPEVEEYSASLEKLYSAIAENTGCSVIVDSSKWPMYAHVLDRLPGLDLYMLHLVRDPRAVAYSWTRNKEEDPGVPMLKQGTLRSTAYWLAWNPAIRFLWNRNGRNYRLLTYERFIAEPAASIAEIVSFAGESCLSLPFAGSHTVSLQRTHAVAGNSARLTSGPIELRRDDEWRLRMPAGSRRLATAMTWPLLGTYGYR